MSWRMFVLDESLDISNAYHSIALRVKQHALHRHSIPAYGKKFADKCARRLETVANVRRTKRRPFVGAVLDRWVQWLVHGPEAISFIVTLILTEHGCSGTYLHEVGEANTTECADSGAREDSVHHVILEYPVFAEYR